MVGNALVRLEDLRLDVAKREVDVPCLSAPPSALLPFTSQSVLGMLCLQLNCATVPLIVTRPMIGSYPIFADVTVWLRKCLSAKPFDAISPLLCGYFRD